MIRVSKVLQGDCGIQYSATKMAAVHWLGTSPLFVRACVNKRIIPLNKPIYMDFETICA